MSRIFVKRRYEVEMENQSNLSPSPLIEIDRKISWLSMLSDRIDRYRYSVYLLTKQNGIIIGEALRGT